MDERELEVKLYVTDLSKIEERLIALGAKIFKRRQHEINLRFDTKNQELSEKKQVLRLRRNDEYLLTFKGPGVNEDGVLARQEIEFNVSDFDAARRILELLGYQVQVIYEKYRTVYQIGDLEISLDELPYGQFVEIEGPEPTLIRAMMNKLNLMEEAQISDNYIEMFHSLVRKLDLDFRDLVFDNFRGIDIKAADLEVEAADRS